MKGWQSRQTSRPRQTIEFQFQTAFIYRNGGQLLRIVSVSEARSIFYEGGGLVSKDVTFDGASVRNVTLSRTTPRGMKVCTRCLSPSLSFCLLARLCTSHLFSLRAGSLIIVAWNSDDSEDRALFWKLNSSWSTSSRSVAEIELSLKQRINRDWKIDGRRCLTVNFTVRFRFD